MPLIAMTREMGSLGEQVAAAVSERLCKETVHQEFTDNLANKMRLRKSHVIRFLDGKASMWERLTTDKTSLSIYTADETFRLAENDHVGVIRGWGAAHLLRPVPHVIGVRVCAPIELRVKRMMERLNTADHDFVAHEIRVSDEAHGAIIRRHFGINWRDPEQYDIVLNTERLTVKECVDEIMDLLDDPEFQETRESMRIFSDFALVAHVRAALRQDSRTSKMQVSITGDNGVITLTGLVNPGEEPKHAVEVAAMVPGVKDVVKGLRMVPASALHHVEG